ncbi:hypothetical protein ACOMHN_052800 [Nucella lapillus]
MKARVPGQWVDCPAAVVMEAREQGRCWIDHPAVAVMEARVQGRHWVDRPSVGPRLSVSPCRFIDVSPCRFIDGSPCRFIDVSPCRFIDAESCTPYLCRLLTLLPLTARREPTDAMSETAHCSKLTQGGQRWDVYCSELQQGWLTFPEQTRMATTRQDRNCQAETTAAISF